MNEKQITICGHGSNTPSLKNLYDYLELRYNSWTTNGGAAIRKKLVAVRRYKNLTEEYRNKFHDAYQSILGRNTYSQDYRDYCYTAYKDGKYYSDCSSSGCLTFQQIGLTCPTYTCGGIYTSSYFETVPVEILAGHIQNPEALQVGDALLFAGSTEGRPLNISHVEYVYEISDEQINGWNKESGSWYYYKNGTKLKKEWVKSNKHWYRLGNDGKMLTGWHKIYDKDGILRDCYFEENSESLLGAMWHETAGGNGYLEIWETE